MFTPPKKNTTPLPTPKVFLFFFDYVLVFFDFFFFSLLRNPKKVQIRECFIALIENTVQYSQNNRASTYTNAKLYPPQPECICGRRDVFQFADELVVAFLMATRRFPFWVFFSRFFWCHLDLFDTTYYAAITIGKHNHVVQSGALVKNALFINHALKFFCFVFFLGPKLSRLSV